MSTDAHLTWVPAAFLAEQKVRPWSDMPVWIPPAGQSAGFAQRSIARALAKGLTFRPFAVTAKDTLDFYETQTEERKAQLRAGLAAAREKEVLAAWHAQARQG
jgi:2'-hydroxyisoflavone reductase